MLGKLSRPHADERGLVLVATLVIVSLLFIIGAAMALAVESNLHTVGQISSEDATHYAAESAVARGVTVSLGASLPLQGSCPPVDLQPVNGVKISKPECYSVGIDRTSPQEVKQWAVPEQKLPVDVELRGLERDASVWTVIGSRGKIKIWIDDCAPEQMDAGAHYYPSPSHPCSPSKGKKSVLHIASDGAPASVSSFVIRAAPTGSKANVVTVIGRAGNQSARYEAAQADVLIPTARGGNPSLGLRSTVLP